MNIKKVTNHKFLAVSLLLSSVIVGLNTQKISAEETTPDIVNVEPVTTTVSTNMLNVHSAVITDVNVKKWKEKIKI